MTKIIRTKKIIPTLLAIAIILSSVLIFASPVLVNAEIVPGSGAAHRRFTGQGPSGNSVVNTVSFHPSANVRTMMGTELLRGSTATTLSSARNLQTQLNFVNGGTVLAGINGDFFSGANGTGTTNSINVPFGMMIESGGRIVKSSPHYWGGPAMGGYAFGVRRCGTAVVGPAPRITLDGSSSRGNFTVDFMNVWRPNQGFNNTGHQFPVDQLVLYTSDWGARTQATGGHEVRIRLTSADFRQGSTVNGTVVASGTAPANGMEIGANHIVLSANSAAVGRISNLQNGDNVTINVGLASRDNQNWNNLDFAIGGSSPILMSGQLTPQVNLTAGSAQYQTRRARTAVGARADGSVVWVTVDEAGGSTGMTMPELARYMRDSLGVVTAIGLDGGGSTQMVTRVGANITQANAPSGTTPRAVANSIMLIYNPNAVDDAPLFGEFTPDFTTVAPTNLNQPASRAGWRGEGIGGQWMANISVAGQNSTIPTRAQARFDSDGMRLSIAPNSLNNTAVAKLDLFDARRQVCVDHSLYFDINTTFAHAPVTSAGFRIQFTTPSLGGGFSTVDFTELLSHLTPGVGRISPGDAWNLFPTRGHYISNGEWSLSKALNWLRLNSNNANNRTAATNALITANNAGGTVGINRYYAVVHVNGATNYNMLNYAHFRWLSIGAKAPDFTCTTSCAANVFSCSQVANVLDPHIKWAVTWVANQNSTNGVNNITTGTISTLGLQTRGGGVTGSITADRFINERLWERIVVPSNALPAPTFLLPGHGGYSATGVGGPSRVTRLNGLDALLRIPGAPIIGNIGLSHQYLLSDISALSSVPFTGTAFMNAGIGRSTNNITMPDFNDLQSGGISFNINSASAQNGLTSPLRAGDWITTIPNRPMTLDINGQGMDFFCLDALGYVNRRFNRTGIHYNWVSQSNFGNISGFNLNNQFLGAEVGYTPLFTAIAQQINPSFNAKNRVSVAQLINLSGTINLSGHGFTSMDGIRILSASAHWSGMGAITKIDLSGNNISRIEDIELFGVIRGGAGANVITPTFVLDRHLNNAQNAAAIATLLRNGNTIEWVDAVRTNSFGVPFNDRNATSLGQTNLPGFRAHAANETSWWRLLDAPDSNVNASGVLGTFTGEGARLSLNPNGSVHMLPAILQGRNNNMQVDFNNRLHFDIDTSQAATNNISAWFNIQFDLTDGRFLNVNFAEVMAHLADVPLVSATDPWGAFPVAGIYQSNGQMTLREALI